MVVKLNGKEICTSKANYGSVAGVGGDTKPWTTIKTMSECDEAIPVKKGDTISIDAIWDKEAHPL